MATHGMTRRNVLLMAGGAAGVLAAPAVARAAGERVVVAAIASNPATFDPINQGNHDAMVVNQLIFENLIEIDGDNRRVPMLAKALPAISDDRLTYLFDLRDDVTFQNGQKFTAEDVKYSFDYILDPAHKALRRSVWTPIDSVDIVSPYQVRFRLKTPYRPLLDYMTKYMGIFPAGSREKYGNDAFQQAPMGLGTGPGIFVSARANDYVEFRRNPNYWRPGTPAWDVLRVLIVSEDAARIASLMTGDVQVIGAPPARDFLRLRNGAKITGASKPATGSLMLMLHNTRKPPFDDIEFRRAVSLATDRKTIAEKVLYGLVEPSALPVSSSTPLYNAAAAATLAFDMEKAKAYLAKSKYAGGAAFELMYSSQPYLLDVKDAALFIQSSLAPLGIKVTLQPVEAGQLIGQAIAGNQASALMAVMGPADPTFMIQSIYTPGQAFSRGSGFEDPRLTALLAESYRFDDAAKLGPVMAEMQDILADQAPSTWIGAMDCFNLWRKDLTGFAPSAGITLRLRDVSVA